MIGKAFWVSVFAALLLSVCLVGLVRGQNVPVIKLNPKDNSAEPDQSFSVSVVVSGITEAYSLYGWSAKFKFDPGVLNGVSASEGAFLGSSGYATMWLTPLIDNSVGSVQLGGLLTPTETGFPPKGAFGDGVLGNVTFKAVGRGSTSLHFEFTELYSVIGVEYQIEHDAEDGSFSNGSATGGLPLQLILVVVVVAVVGIGGGALLYLRKKRR